MFIVVITSCLRQLHGRNVSCARAGLHYGLPHADNHRRPLPAIGIAGMRAPCHNVVALSGKAVEASGNVDVVLLDKTGTITLGNRMATEFIPAKELQKKSWRSRPCYPLLRRTPEGQKHSGSRQAGLGIRGKDIRPSEGSTFIPFSARPA